MPDSGESVKTDVLLGRVSDMIRKPYSPGLILRRVENVIKLPECSSMVSQLQYGQLTGLYTREYFYGQANEILTAETDREYEEKNCRDFERLLSEKQRTP